MKETVYCTAIAKGGDIEWDFAWVQYLEEDLAQEKERLLRGLGCSQDLETLSK